ncbi:uncharacterized protein MEPE_03685 [Melanopsichium pennsylvanicum]|uniref:Fms interacting protein n=2 Tax=Melanopsichium pennsylvanicum TaxID=63383 RepID=A0AAJ5C5Q3_9BASI|nr:conserved hypothetical protein [Melanopsichium pennsylvanicum 4]SNX84976.1 uncharacterized protein MEPE_03685 [Melanopsichium pennsylvanicum]
MATSAEEQLKHTLASLSELSDLKVQSADEDLCSSISEANRAAAMQLLALSTPLFSNLKRVNRSIYTELNAQKLRVAQERAKVDTARLALQNLKYEESMLELEVKVCQEFQSIFQDISIHELEEFHALRSQRTLSQDTDEAMEDAKKDTQAKGLKGEDEDEDEELDDDHKLMLARLRFELRERKRLETEKQRLQQDKTEVTKDNKDKKMKLEQVEKQLKDLLTAAQAVQAKFESF